MSYFDFVSRTPLIQKVSQVEGMQLQLRLSKNNVATNGKSKKAQNGFNIEQTPDDKKELKEIDVKDLINTYMPTQDYLMIFHGVNFK